MSTVSAYLLYNLSGPDPWRIKHKNHNLLSLNLYISFSMSVRRTVCLRFTTHITNNFTAHPCVYRNIYNTTPTVSVRIENH